MIPVYHQCDFCPKTFVNKENLRKHEEKCEFKLRHDFITNHGAGINMYKLYLYWLRSNGKSIKYVDRQTFIHSIHYKAFKRFIKFAKKKSIPDKKTYIKICNGFNLSPRDWTLEKTYEIFLEVFDELIPVNKQIEKSVDTIYTLADALEIEPENIFEELDASDISRLIRARKISPWFFLNSAKFKKFLCNRASAKDREHIQKSTNTQRWKEIFSKNPKKRNNVRSIIKQMGL